MSNESVVHTVTIDPLFARALTRQREIQRVHMGGLPSQMDDEVLSAFIRDMTLALCGEAHEAMDETQWKPWARIDPTQPIIKNRDRYTGELADVFIFLMNLMLAGDISASEMMRAVDHKQQINIDRQVKGYTGQNKCPACKRAYDDAAVNCVPAESEGLHRTAWCENAHGFVDEKGTYV